jgi:hypothetical protein
VAGSGRALPARSIQSSTPARGGSSLTAWRPPPQPAKASACRACRAGRSPGPR